MYFQSSSEYKFRAFSNSFSFLDESITELDAWLFTIDASQFSDIEGLGSSFINTDSFFDSES